MMSKNPTSALRAIAPSVSRPAKARRSFSSTQPVSADLDTAAFGEKHIAKGFVVSDCSE
jgi:4-aminobutyrate aminotransferase